MDVVDKTTKICLTGLAALMATLALLGGIFISTEVVAVFAGLAGTALGALGGIAVQKKVNGQ